MIKDATGVDFTAVSMGDRREFRIFDTYKRYAKTVPISHAIRIPHKIRNREIEVVSQNEDSRISRHNSESTEEGEGKRKSFPIILERMIQTTPQNAVTANTLIKRKAIFFMNKGYLAT